MTREVLNLISAIPYHVIITYRQLEVGRSDDEVRGEERLGLKKCPFCGPARWLHAAQTEALNSANNRTEAAPHLISTCLAKS
jgi:hypothetical protein